MSDDVLPRFGDVQTAAVLATFPGSHLTCRRTSGEHAMVWDELGGQADARARAETMGAVRLEQLQRQHGDYPNVAEADQFEAAASRAGPLEMLPLARCVRRSVDPQGALPPRFRHVLLELYHMRPDVHVIDRRRVESGRCCLRIDANALTDLDELLGRIGKGRFVHHFVFHQCRFCLEVAWVVGHERSLGHLQPLSPSASSMFSG
jgi:hypothetical protein